MENTLTSREAIPSGSYRELIPTDQLITHPALQTRAESPEHIESLRAGLAQAKATGSEWGLPPLKVAQLIQGGTAFAFIVDGHHRYKANQWTYRTGDPYNGHPDCGIYPAIPCEVQTCETWAGVQALALRANLDNGLALTREERKANCLRLLEIEPYASMSARQLVPVFGVGHMTIHRWRTDSEGVSNDTAVPNDTPEPVLVNAGRDVPKGARNLAPRTVQNDTPELSIDDKLASYVGGNLPKLSAQTDTQRLQRRIVELENQLAEARYLLQVNGIGIARAGL